MSTNVLTKKFTVRGSQCFKEWSPWCWMVWSGSRPACLRLPFICLPVLLICLPVLVICLPGHPLSPAAHSPSPAPHSPPPAYHFFSIVSQFLSFVSQAGCLWSGSRLACLPLPFICLPVLVICLPGHPLSPAPHSPPPAYHFFSIVSQFLSFVSQAGCLWSGSRLAGLPLPFILGACGRVVGRLVSHFLECVSHFFSIDSQAGCLWSGSRLACRPLPCFCLPFPFICLPLLFICLPGWVLVVGFPGGLSPKSLHLSPTFSPNSLLLGFLNSFLRRVRPLCHCWCRPISTGHVTFLFIRLPDASLLVSALFRWPCSISIHVSPRSVTGGVRPFPLVV